MDYRFSKEDLKNDTEYMVGAFSVNESLDWYPSSDYKKVYYVSEKLISRIFGVAVAYQLHFSAYFPVDYTVRFSINSKQIDSILDELYFLQDLLNDKAVKQAIKTIFHLGVEVQRSNGRLKLVFEGP